MGTAAAADIILLAEFARRTERRDAAFKHIERAVDRFLQCLKIGSKCVRRLIALIKRRVHRLHHDLFQRFRDRRRDLTERCRDRREVFERNRPVIVAVKRQFAGEHFIHDDTKRIDIAPAIYREAPGLLRRDIMHRADRLILHIRHFGLEVGNAKIRDFDDAVIDNKDVLRLDIAVNNAFPVRVAERPRDLQREIHRLRRIERAVVLQILLERDAVHELHDNILHMVCAAHIVYADNVRVAELCDRLRFRLKAAAKLFVLRKLRPHDLHGYIAVEPVAHRFIHDRHAAAADELHKLIPAVEHHAAVFILIICIHIVPP